MPRFLWLGLLVCAIGALTAVVFVRAVEPADAPAPQSIDEIAPVRSVSATLIDDEESSASERAPVLEASVAIALPARDDTHAGSERVTVYPELRDIRLEDGVVEVRVVRDEDGTPIEGASVAQTTNGAPVYLTDAAGVVVITGVAGPRSWISARANLRSETSAPVDMDRQSRQGTLELRLPAHREVLVCVLDPLGRPFRPADWHLGRDDCGQLGIVLAGACGRAGSPLDIRDAPVHRTRSAFLEDCPFAWRVEIRGRGDACVHAVLGDMVVAVAPLESWASRVELRLDGDALENALATVVVRVVDANGDIPIVDALVEFQHGTTTRSSGRTDAHGRMDAGRTSAGSLEVRVSAKGRAPQSSSIARPIPAEIVVRLQPGRLVTGRVVDQDRVPIANTLLLVDGEGAEGVDGVRTSSDGTFAIEDLPVSELVVRAIHRPSGPHGAAVSASAEADCRERDVLGLEIQLNVPRAAAPTPR